MTERSPHLPVSHGSVCVVDFGHTVPPHDGLTDTTTSLLRVLFPHPAQVPQLLQFQPQFTGQQTRLHALLSDKG